MADPSKTEKATPKRIKDAREEGNVPRSQELCKTMVLFFGVLSLFFYAHTMYGYIAESFRYIFLQIPIFTENVTSLRSLSFTVGLYLAKIVFPFLIVIVLVSFMTTRIQVGKLWTTKVFKFSWERFNVVEGVKRIFFNRDAYVALLKSILQACIIGIAPYIVVKREFHNFSTMYFATPYQFMEYLLRTAFTMMIYAFIPMIGIALFDVWYTRFRYAEKLKMTKPEVKEEQKQQEGDVEQKQAMQRKMRAMNGKRIKQLIPVADVIVTNPTHFAVALKYDPSVASAPIVIAKGRNMLAQKIKEVARSSGVPIKENKPLAQALYKQVEVGDVIPQTMYRAVALILSELSKFKKR